VIRKRGKAVTSDSGSALNRCRAGTPSADHALRSPPTLTNTVKEDITLIIESRLQRGRSVFTSSGLADGDHPVGKIVHLCDALMI
jgi:hypothetical protein